MTKNNDDHNDNDSIDDNDDVVGRLEGDGVMQYRDGHQYVGTFVNWVKSGHGTMTYR